MKHKLINPNNEITAVLQGAAQIGQQCRLNELCTETLLYAIAENNQLSANAKLKALGVNVTGFKAMLLKRLEKKAKPAALIPIPESTAVIGLLFLNSRRDDSCQLLKCIIQNKNTAAARLLSQERLSLNEYNELIYKPIEN